MIPSNHFENYHEWNVVSQTPIQQDGETYYKIVFERPLSKMERLISNFTSIFFEDDHRFGSKRIVDGIELISEEVISKQSLEMHLVSLMESYKPIQEFYHQAIKTNNQETGHDIQINLSDEATQFGAFTCLNNGSIALGFGRPIHRLLFNLVFELTNVTSIKESKEHKYLEENEYVKAKELKEFKGMKTCIQFFRQAIEKDAWNSQLRNNLEKTICNRYVIGANDSFESYWEEIKNSSHAKGYGDQHKRLGYPAKRYDPETV